MARQSILGVATTCAALGLAFAQPYGEAPSLAERVAAGDLPPVEERLPASPFVREVNESIGRYGGTLNVTNLTESPLDQFPGNGNNGTLLSRDQDDPEGRIYPYVAESLEGSEDATVWTLKLREGVRWSDGAPLTADDLMFYYDDVIFNTDLNSSPPTWLIVAGEPVRVEKVDDYTITYTFAAPFPFFELFLFWQGEEILRYPKHYLQDFHATYQTPEELQSFMDEGGFDSWQELFDAKVPFGQGQLTVGAPSLDPWIPVSTPTAGPYVFERNAYFWAVDADGNQLPYIDQVIVDVVPNLETLNLRVLAGQVDLRNMCTADMLPLVMQASQRGELQAFRSDSDNGAGLDLHFNQTSQDPDLRGLFSDARFRQAVSLGIDRQRIADLAFLGLVTPTQSGPPEGTEYYHEGLKNAFVELDAERANALLDEIGLTERDSDGYRLFPNGEQVAFNVTSYLQSISEDAHELIVDDLQALGLNANMHRPEASEPYEDDNTFDAILANGPRSEAWSFAAGTSGPWVPLARRPSGPYPAMWAGQYAVWAAGDGTQGEEPPQLLKDIVDWYRQLQSEPNESARQELARQIFDAAAENVWVVGLVTSPGCVTVANSDLRNVPDMIYFYRNAVEPEQLYFETAQ